MNRPNRALNLLWIIAALGGLAAAAAVTAALLTLPEPANHAGRIQQAGGALIRTSLAVTIVRAALTGWQDAPGQPPDRLARVSAAAGRAAAVIIFSLGAAMLLHPHMFR